MCNLVKDKALEKKKHWKIEITFFPAFNKPRVSCVANVLFPTPPLPERMRITCFTDERLSVESKYQKKEHISA